MFDKDGKPLAIFLVDYYARPSKKGGAWMNEYVNQSGLLDMKPVVANHLNIPKPEAGQPTLLTYDEVRTAFHEFGHALHGMFSNVKYPRFSGTSVPRDFVEYPSQVNEMWATWPEVLQHYAKHYQTGAPMPKELLDKVLAAEKFNQGFKTTEYLAATLLDQAWHQLKPSEVPDNVLAFEASALKKAGVDFAPVPPRYRTTYFSHAFAGGYSAGYYSYIWSEVLDADSVEWFKEHGGLKRENGDHFRDTLLSRGGSQDAMKLFHNFTGRDPWIEPLLEAPRAGAGAEAPRKIESVVRCLRRTPHRTNRTDTTNRSHSSHASHPEGFTPPHGGYEDLLSFQKARIIFDGTVRFCDRFVDKRSRTRDQMVQAARSGKQNILEGSQASGTSKETELKLTNVARASLEELLEDYRDFLRSGGHALWHKNSKEALYVRKLGAKSNRSYESYRSYFETRPPEIVANILICLIHQTNYLLDQQLRRLEQDFLAEGGLRERMTRARLKARAHRQP